MTEAELLAAILAAPDDDGPRQVYADWLLDRDDLRGELISIQLELARIEQCDPKRPRLEARDLQLQKQLKDALPPGSRYERGFPTLLPIRANELPTLPVMLSRAPYRSFSVIGLTAADIPALASAPLGTVRELMLSPMREGLGLDELRLLASWPALERVESLYLSGEYDLTGLARVLARCPLRELSLIGDRPGEPTVQTILAYAPRLQALNLTGMALPAAALAALAELPLRELHLAETATSTRDLERARALLAKLELLYLDGSLIGDELGELFASAKGRLLTLRVRIAEQLGDRGFAALVTAPILRDATELQLFRTAITPVGVRALVDAGSRPLATLGLSCSAIGDEGAALLASWPGARSLRRLYLDECGITDAGVRALATSPYLQGLEHISFYRTEATSPGIDRAFGARRHIVHGVPKD